MPSYRVRFLSVQPCWYSGIPRGIDKLHLCLLFMDLNSEDALNTGMDIGRVPAVQRIIMSSGMRTNLLPMDFSL